RDRKILGQEGHYRDENKENRSNEQSAREKHQPEPVVTQFLPHNAALSSNSPSSVVRSASFFCYGLRTTDKFRSVNEGRTAPVGPGLPRCAAVGCTWRYGRYDSWSRS